MSPVTDRPERHQLAVRKVVVGSRDSRLARVQAEWVGMRLKEAWPDLSIVYWTTTTIGDRERDVPISEIGGQGVFTSALESALVEGTIDLAVHSLKDLPTKESTGTLLVAVPPREDPRDALVVGPGVPVERGSFEALSSGARVGTSSLRRSAQVRAIRPDLRVTDVRGNVDTRLKKLETGAFEALILAAAGLKRLGLWSSNMFPLETNWLPAPGQGALGVQGRLLDLGIRELARPLEDRKSRVEVTAERSLLANLEGGCQVPIASRANVESEDVQLSAAVYDVEGILVPIVGTERGHIGEAVEVGERLAHRLKASGAGVMVENAREFRV
jgi:hydroxymethylbilane synthase